MVGFEIGFAGLGKMGLNMVKRILRSPSNIRVVAWNRSPEPLKEAEEHGAIPAESIMDLVAKLESKKKVVWLMFPAGEVTEKFFQETLVHLNSGDIIIDGANSNFHDSIRRHDQAKEKGIFMLDAGVSGGLVGAKKGYALMIGGKKEAYDYCIPVFEVLAQKEGYALVSEKGGAGHYVKMVHNAIEYGMMQAISEGFDLLQKGSFKEGMDLKKVSKVWNHGTIISSFLMEMAKKALEKDPALGYLKPFVEESGEGRWAALDAMENKVPFAANTYSLNARFLSQDENSFAFRLLAAIRAEFGGHEVKKK